MSKYECPQCKALFGTKFNLERHQGTNRCRLNVERQVNSFKLDPVKLVPGDTVSVWINQMYEEQPNATLFKRLLNDSETPTFTQYQQHRINLYRNMYQSCRYKFSQVDGDLIQELSLFVAVAQNCEHHIELELIYNGCVLWNLSWRDLKIIWSALSPAYNPYVTDIRRPTYIPLQRLITGNQYLPLLNRLKGLELKISYLGSASAIPIRLKANLVKLSQYEHKRFNNLCHSYIITPWSKLTSSQLYQPHQQIMVDVVYPLDWDQTNYGYGLESARLEREQSEFCFTKSIAAGLPCALPKLLQIEDRPVFVRYFTELEVRKDKNAQYMPLDGSHYANKLKLIKEWFDYYSNVSDGEPVNKLPFETDNLYKDAEGTYHECDWGANNRLPSFNPDRLQCKDNCQELQREIDRLCKLLEHYMLKPGSPMGRDDLLGRVRCPFTREIVGSKIYHFIRPSTGQKYQFDAGICHYYQNLCIDPSPEFREAFMEWVASQEHQVASQEHQAASEEPQKSTEP